MANVIKLKRGTSTPTTSDITSGEVALDTSAKKLYVNDSGTVKEIGGGSAGMTAESSAPKNTHSNNAGSSLTSDSIQNTLIGEGAGNNISTGDYNVIVGQRAGHTVNNSEETLIGTNCFSERGNHLRAVGLGFGAGSWNRGTNVTAIGYQSLYWGSDSSNSKHNVAVGFKALYGDSSDSSGNNSTAVGYQALYARSTGDNNSALGHSALKALTSGAANVGLGYEAGNAITTGSNNCVLGTDAANSGTNDLTTGDNNIIIGYNAAASAADVDNEITLGNSSITKFRVPALNFTVKSSTATEGYVLTVDANGEAGFAEASGGGPAGGGSDKVFFENAQTVTTNYTIGDTFGAACNAMSAGPISINSGVTVTINSGEVLTIV